MAGLMNGLNGRIGKRTTRNGWTNIWKFTTGILGDILFLKKGRKKEDTSIKEVKKGRTKGGKRERERGNEETEAGCFQINTEKEKKMSRAEIKEERKKRTDS